MQLKYNKLGIFLSFLSIERLNLIFFGYPKIPYVFPLIESPFFQKLFSRPVFSDPKTSVF